jgi:hypothetical protein
VSESNEKLLTNLQRACSPHRPATQEEYVNTIKARGCEPLDQMVINKLAALTQNERIRLPYSGHIGSGKTTELIRVIRELNNRNDLPFYFVMVQTEDFLNFYDMGIEDILIGLVAVLKESAHQNGIKLEDSYIFTKFQEFKDMLFSEIEINSVELPMKVKAELKNMSKENRRKMWRALKGQDESLGKMVNDLVIQFTTKLNSKKIKGRSDLQLVLVFDGLEKTRRFEDREEGLASVKALFIDNSSTFLELPAHLILTAPISSARACFNILQRGGYSSLETIPSVKVTERDGNTKYEQGYDTFREIVQHRLPPGAKLSDYFSTEALDFLIKYSGGYIRGFLSAIQEACYRASTNEFELPIQLHSAQRAFRPFVANSALAITPTGWNVLASIEASELKNKINPEDPNVQVLLNENHILEYINGNQSVQTIGRDEPWYAVHPVLRELENFKSAVGLLVANRDKNVE